jgi:hypothetical protein
MRSLAYCCSLTGVVSLAVTEGDESPVRVWFSRVDLGGAGSRLPGGRPDAALQTVRSTSSPIRTASNTRCTGVEQRDDVGPRHRSGPARGLAAADSLFNSLGI